MTALPLGGGPGAAGSRRGRRPRALPERLLHAARCAAVLVVLLAAVPVAVPAATAWAQLLPGSGTPTPDSLVAKLGLPEGHSPDGALRRALMVPGWGQYYNRQYWKVPLAVAGLGGVVYALAYNWDRYYLYRDAWRFRREGGTFFPPPSEDEPDLYEGGYGGSEYEEAYRELLGQIGGTFGDPLPTAVRQQRGQFRRRREMAIVGTALFWLLQTADAYVSAHLLGFDADDLSMQVLPSSQGMTGRLRISF